MSVKNGHRREEMTASNVFDMKRNKKIVAITVIVGLLNKNPGKHIKANSINETLKAVGLNQDKMGDLLFYMKNRRMISNSAHGWYTKYDPKYDKNITRSVLAADNAAGLLQGPNNRMRT